MTHVLFSATLVALLATMFAWLSSGETLKYLKGDDDDCDDFIAFNFTRDVMNKQ